MALRDYILCGECETKLVYDGNDEAREWLEERYGDPSCNCYTVKLLCPTCLATLRAQNAELTAENERLKTQSESLARSVMSDHVSNDSHSLFIAAIRDLAAINEHLDLDPDDGGAVPIIGAIDELRAALVSAKTKLHFALAIIGHPEDAGTVALENEIKQIDVLLSGQPDGPGEEDGPWAEGWKERCGQPVEDPRDKFDCIGADWTDRD